MPYKVLITLSNMCRPMRATLTAATLGAAMFAGIVEGAGSSQGASQQAREAISMRASGNTILITGGGSGIGRELARRFNEQGNTVLVVGRRMSTLQKTIAGRKNMSAYVLDVDDPAAIATFTKQVVVDHPKLNVLINNAGIMRYEDLSKQRDLSDAEAQITTNLLGPIRLTNALIDHLKSQPNPVVVNASSGLAFVPRSDAGTYGATKAAIHSYTMALRDQLKGKVKVIEIVPPAIQTELTPGQSSREGFMPLGDFMDEVMAIFAQQPTPDEVLVSRAVFQRWAEREDRFDQAFKVVNAKASAVRR
ncbi:SDR family oxidoreductase [Pollutimonas subterranea]|nr:SDR family oxidoreductase [Pollutimonas subterranea]